MKSSWVYSVSECGDNGVIYQADSYCEDCGNQIRHELNKSGKKPEDPEDEHSYDSDEYPKYADWSSEESDSPQHCGSGEECINAIELPCGSKIGGWLGGSLTREGSGYVEEIIFKDLFTTSEHSRQVGRLWRHLYRDQVENKVEEVDSTLANRLSNVQPTLWKNLGKKSDKDGVDILTLLADLDNVYAVATRDKPKAMVHVYRSEIDQLGNFGEIDSAKVTSSDFESERVADAVKSIANDEGWR